MSAQFLLCEDSSIVEFLQFIMNPDCTEWAHADLQAWLNVWFHTTH